MQFLVPQFIDIEPKVIGPITVRQFILIMVGGILMVICYKLSDFSLFIVEALFIIAVFGFFAFVKINGRPFHYFVLNFLQTQKRAKLRIWGKEILTEKEEKAKVPLPKVEIAPILERKRIMAKGISDLSLIVDTGGAYSEES